MTEIDVPDWVVEVAAEAISKRHLSNTGVPFPIAACRDDARAALTAALGAWVVPVGYVHEQTLSDLNDCIDKPSLRAGGTIWSCQGGPYTEALYTLRQEKLE